MSVLWITSFNEKMYEVSGKQMIKSFVEFQPDDHKLIAYYEGVDLSNLKTPNVVYYPLDNSELLNNWLNENQDIIPKYLGGTCTKPAICQNMWNKKASCWFRKIVSIHETYEIDPEYKYIMWIDADCFFQQRVSTDMISDLFGKTNNVIYHFGTKRLRRNQGWESSILGLKGIGGKLFFNKVVKCYTSKKFQKYSRWDDGFIFRMIAKEVKNPLIQLKDLCKDVSANNIVGQGPFNGYIKHDKGKHKRIGINEK